MSSDKYLMDEMGYVITPINDVFYIPENILDTSIILSFSANTMNNKYIIKNDSVLTNITITIPSLWGINEKGMKHYIKNYSNNNVIIMYQTDSFRITDPILINSNNPYISQYTIYQKQLNINPNFMMIYWDGVKLLMV
jgi:hypothetical protein